MADKRLADSEWRRRTGFDNIDDRRVPVESKKKNPLVVKSKWKRYVPVIDVDDHRISSQIDHMLFGRRAR